ncbi:MAG: hypothetical protein IKM35_03420 [Bacteroidaceae bacterium]|nr:hypothetical protein [Bacteroidaceae bacterium]
MKPLKKSIFIPSILLIYLGVMAYMGRDQLLSGNYWEFFGILIVTLLCIIMLHITLRKQEKIRERRRAEMNKHNTDENSDKENNL